MAAPGGLIMIGRTISHYRIEGALGRGGMGVVYKALDTRLGRSVALKVIAPERTADPLAKERFLQEARAVSVLDHPNVCTVHEIGETPEGELFLVMAFYEGPTLAEVLRHGALACPRAIGFTRQVLGGLAAAHERRIIHRDVKPANAIVTERGLLKLVDFGLAKLLAGPAPPPAPDAAGPDRLTLDARPDSTGLTTPGMVVGTAAYLAPEQCHGYPADERSDLWSVGVMLYEMLTGRLPFREADRISLLYSICTREAEPLQALRPDLPLQVDGLVRRALEKDPARRFASAREFLKEIDEPSSASPLPADAPRSSRSAARSLAAAPEPAILVLPFADPTGDADAGLLGDGLTDEIITDLSGFGALRVISRTSAMQLKGTTKDLRTLGRELAVRYVLEGSVRRVKDELRISAKLVDASTDTSFWARRYGGRADEVFDIQERISRDVVASLRLQLDTRGERRLAAAPIPDLQVYELYLRARQEVLSFQSEGLERAARYLETGITKVGDHPLLLSTLGYVYWQSANCGASADPAALDKARAAAVRVLELDPDAARGHLLLGLTAVPGGDLQEVVRHLKTAIALDPNDPDTLFWLTVMYGFAGRPGAGEPLAARLLQVDPLTPFHHVLPAFLATMRGDFARAPDAYRKAYRMDPSNPITRLAYAQVLALAGRIPEAIDAFDLILHDLPEGYFPRIARVISLALRGCKDEVVAAVDEGIAGPARADFQNAWTLAEAFALVGEGETSVSWLEVAIERGFGNYPLLAEHDPLLAGVRGEPGFRRLMDGLRPRWERFEA